MGGHRPPSPKYCEPTRESFHLALARAAYVSGDISVERFEILAAHVLAGGHLTQDLQIPPVGQAPFNESPFPMPVLVEIDKL